MNSQTEQDLKTVEVPEDLRDKDSIGRKRNFEFSLASL